MPLNGTNIHPLTEHAFSVLGSITTTPRPCNQVNPGVIRRLMDEGLAETVNLPSPYATHKGKPILHLKATEAGRERFAKGR